MRTSILAITAAFAAVIAVPALAQTTSGEQQIQSNKRMQQEADKGIMTRNSGDSGFVGQQQKPGLPRMCPDNPNRAARRGAPERAVAGVPRLAVRASSRFQRALFRADLLDAIRAATGLAPESWPLRNI